MPLVSVLWGLTLLTVLSLSLSWSGSVSYSLAHNGIEQAGLNTLVEAGVNAAIDGLLETNAERRWRADGSLNKIDFNGTQIGIRVQDELGRIDLNQTDEAMLSSLLQSAGLDVQAAGSLTDKIVDWRTATSLKHLNGAKDRDYASRNAAYHPRNGPFQSVGELLLVMDMTPAIFERIAPALTVHSGRQFVDPQLAPREVLRVLPGMSAQSAEAAIAARDGGRANSGLVEGNPMTVLRGRAFTIRTEFTFASRMVEGDVAIRLTENPQQPYWVLSWTTR
ncbi:putative general secretion pathway protein K [Bradyrhizobium oligotrophicum S58]|uniref:Putative general secretion pathway protein K n=1 Tax=Bradyrhizobium oligotrophicum S58 TaxID=1245469 RepID=M4ZDS6_9BRAD|nr:type II secretion system protein GspK [Bradyrhizobium oligotrophicum]BAM91977.1 putative general secretion pathway protein K [Bradyrhizobium oligotrophicum S58]